MLQVLIYFHVLLKMINSDMNINGKMINLKSCINDPKPHQTVIANITNNTIIKNSHNTTNIMINNFGKEEISYLDSNYFKNLIMNQHIETGYVQLIKDIYLNKEHPENGTVKIENINNKYALVYDNGKWNTILKYELRDIFKLIEYYGNFKNPFNANNFYIFRHFVYNESDIFLNDLIFSFCPEKQFIEYINYVIENKHFVFKEVFFFKFENKLGQRSIESKK